MIFIDFWDTFDKIENLIYFEFFLIKIGSNNHDASDDGKKKKENYP